MNAPAPVTSASSSEHFVETALGRLFVAERGRGGQETIVLWPSIFTDHNIYAELLDLMADRYRFLLIDGPAHGKSEGTEWEFSMRDCADAILSVLDHFALPNAIIGGTSWGGLAAAELALIQPGKVKALILMNTPMEIDGTRPDFSARMIAAGARWAVNFSFFQNGVAKSFFRPETLAQNTAYRNAFFSMLTTFGTPLDVTVQNLRIESMFPADAETSALLSL